MQSLKQLYKCGPGPSSSHTIAPKRAIEMFMQHYPGVKDIEVTLYGSLSLTGKGHGTDAIIIDTFAPNHATIQFDLQWEHPFPNGLRIVSKTPSFEVEWCVYSLGGGSIEIVGLDNGFNREVYPEKNFEEILEVMQKSQWSFIDYLNHYEPDVFVWLDYCLDQMVESVDRGLQAEGYLKGNLKVLKGAKSLFQQACLIPDISEQHKMKLMSYAYAANEENASGKQVVTAPTLGACGVIAACVYHLINDLKIERELVLKGLGVGGIFGNIIKQNATISGAVGGCQAEVGTACAMASAMLAYVFNLNLKQIEYAAEMAIEHHLGLTCDPVGGYVIIPCIERNALAASRSFDHYSLAKYMHPIKENHIKFDTVVSTMNFTGQKIAIELKETSLGGLAKEYVFND